MSINLGKIGLGKTEREESGRGEDADEELDLGSFGMHVLRFDQC